MDSRAGSDLMVIVPRDLQGRTSSLNEALVGSHIRVVVDRRHQERRRESQPAVAERRQDDRRAAPRVVAYVYSCPVVAVRPPSNGH